MAIQPFTVLKSSVVPLPVENVDTDQIIPARFLKATTREGFGDNLFCDWRFDKEGNPVESFVLNNPVYKGSILVAGKNFGSGSSREHAAWAIGGYGFRAVISSFFADIFKNNALNNGILPVQVTDEFLALIFEAVDKNPLEEVVIDLEKQEVSLPVMGRSEKFDINSYKKTCLINGYDDIDFLISLKEEIKSFDSVKPY